MNGEGSGSGRALDSTYRLSESAFLCEYSYYPHTGLARSAGVMRVARAGLWARSAGGVRIARAGRSATA